MAEVKFKDLRPGVCDVVMKNKRTGQEKSFKGECVILPKSKKKVIYGIFPGDGNWEDVSYKQRTRSTKTNKGLNANEKQKRNKK